MTFPLILLVQERTLDSRTALTQSSAMETKRRPPRAASLPLLLLLPLLCAHLSLPRLSLAEETLRPAPNGQTAPPDEMVPYPPAAPQLPDRNVGNINNIYDVCHVCTQQEYSDQCYGDYTLNCLSAMRSYFTNVMGVEDRYCDCYSAVYSQLTVACPAINSNVLYNTYCDKYCFFGLACPVRTLLYAVVKPAYTELANRVTGDAVNHRIEAAKFGSAAALVDLRLNKNGDSQMCFRVGADFYLPKPMTAATVRMGFLGQAGPSVQTMWRDNNGDNSRNKEDCVQASFSTIQQIGANPGNFYVAIDTPQGGARGQLMPSVDLMAYATSKKANVGCSQSSEAGQETCSALVDFSVTTSGMTYSIVYGPGDAKNPGVAQVQRCKIHTWGEATIWPPVLTLPANGPNSAGISVQTAMYLMSGMHLVNITTQEHPEGAFIGNLTDSLTLDGYLTGSQVVTGNGLNDGGVYFRAQVGAGGLCFKFSLNNVNLNNPYAYIHQADKGQTGPYVLPNTIQVTDSQTACIQATNSITGPILSNPSNFYVQIYVGDNDPKLRGQLGVADPQGL